jgi:deoxyribose-phosphate aldolase
MNISNYIDYTLLKPDATSRDIMQLCEIATENNYHSICVNSCYVSLANQLLNQSDVKICSTVGFPLGSMSTAAKVLEAEKAIEDGASEIDMVINIGYLKSGNYMAVLKDITDVKLAVGKAPLKAIIEVSELSKNEIIKACEICLDANVDFIKTSSGFSKSGATLTAVKIIKKTIKNRAKIKASGGIRDFETAIKYIDAGADRIGTSTAIKSEDDGTILRNTKIFKYYIEQANQAKTKAEIQAKSATR